MLCQNCNKNEANMHMKRILGGRATEVHLCSDCARSLGYGEAFSDFGVGFGDFLSDFLLKNESQVSSMRCHTCGKSFEEIAEDGKMGCADCYAVFYDKLLPSLRKLHGKTSHIGKQPLKSAQNRENDMLAALKMQLEKAVAEQNFELAVKIRDKINSLSMKGGDF